MRRHELKLPRRTPTNGRGPERTETRSETGADGADPSVGFGGRDLADSSSRTRSRYLPGLHLRLFSLVTALGCVGLVGPPPASASRSSPRSLPSTREQCNRRRVSSASPSWPPALPIVRQRAHALDRLGLGQARVEA
jgi:hypothetical protein